jgi:hypothetical protein
VDLHSIVSGAIGTVNPFVLATLRQSDGYTTNADGTRTPNYVDTVMRIQVQPMSSDELKQVEGLNIQGNKTAIYLRGNWNGVVRVDRQGGDLFKFAGKTWLASVALENWPDWSKIMVVEQMDGR